MFSLLSLLLRRSRTSMIVIAVTGIFSGFCNSALLALISHALGTDQSSLKTMLVGFIALSVGVLVGNTVPELLLAKVSRSITAELRLKLGRSILVAPYRRLEIIGKGPVLAALSQDVQAIVNIASKIPGLIVCTTIVLGCLGYMAWLSPRGMTLVLPAMTLLVVFYYFATSSAGAQELIAVIAEVHNTYGGRHVYLLRPDESGKDTVDKRFYVSPFLPMGGSYLMRTPMPDDKLSVSIALRQGGQTPFVATLNGRGRAITTRSAATALLRWPLLTLRTAALIRWQGIRLWLRKVPVQPRPADATRPEHCR